MTAHAHARATSSKVLRPRRPFATGVALVSATGLLALGLTVGTASAAASPVLLGTAGQFAVLAATAVTNTGPSVVSGDLGVRDTAPTGFPPGLVLGVQHVGNAVADQAQQDLTTAYVSAAGQAPDQADVAAELGGAAFGPGVYRVGSSAGLTGTVTLDAGGVPGAVFLFQIPSTLTTAADSRVLLLGGASPCNVFWQIGASATFGVRTSFSGTVLAQVSATVTTGAAIEGRLLVRTGAVTLDTNAVTRPACDPPAPDPDPVAPPVPTDPAPTTPAPTTPAPAPTDPDPTTPAPADPAPSTPTATTPADPPPTTPADPAPVTPVPVVPADPAPVTPAPTTRRPSPRRPSSPRPPRPPSAPRRPRPRRCRPRRPPPPARPRRRHRTTPRPRPRPRARRPSRAGAHPPGRRPR
jgi:type VI secretion system secreted protein VgrG